MEVVGVIQNLPVGHISGFGPGGLDAAEGSIAGDEQEFVKQGLSCRNVVGNSGCSHFHLYLEAFPYSFAGITNSHLLSRHHS